MTNTFEVLATLLGDDYVTDAGVFLLDEHILTDRSGENEMMIDAAFLAEVAANNNARLEQTGDPTPLIIGHTEDGPGKEEKPVKGYATNFRLEPFFDSGRQALKCDFHVRRENEQILKDYPRRSVELWPKKREIDPISLLGGTTPERDLGILRFSRSGGDDSITLPTPTRYQRESDQMADENKTEKDSKTAETAGFRELSAKVDKLAEMMAPLVQFLSEAMGDQGAAEQPPADAEQPQGKEPPQPPADDEDDLMGPADDADDQPEEDEMKESAEYHDTPVKFGDYDTYMPKVAKMSRSTDDVIKLQRQVQKMEQENKEMKLKYARMEAEKLVSDLEQNEGIVFATRKDTIDMIAQLSGAAKKHYIEKEIKMNYARDVARVEDLSRFSRETSGGEKPQTMEDIQREIASAHAKRN
jgi:hypothetical protein